MPLTTLPTLTGNQQTAERQLQLLQALLAQASPCLPKCWRMCRTAAAAAAVAVRPMQPVRNSRHACCMRVWACMKTCAPRCRAPCSQHWILSMWACSWPAGQVGAWCGSLEVRCYVIYSGDAD
eukprot:scaffold53281_cov15-Tisochrysis_lutea.AAC.1